MTKDEVEMLWAEAVDQRDELLEALQKIADYGEADGSPFAVSAAKTARAAIAKATASESGAA